MAHVLSSLSLFSLTLRNMVFFALMGIVWTTTLHAPALARSAPDSFAHMAKELLPGVVNISTTTVMKKRAIPDMPQFPPGSPLEDFFREFFERNLPQNQGPNGRNNRQRQATSLGSGFIISENGYIVTNNHVIDGADKITVITHDDTTLDATLVGRDPRTDLAVLKVQSDTPLPAVKFGDSSAAQVGDWVLAIGNPFGLGGTVTAGIISARGRDINAGPYDNFIQTDASINRGNSGGPMFNMDSEVIGVNAVIYSPSGGSVGIGFAIPSAVVKPVVEQLIATGSVRRGWLGVFIQDVSDDMAEAIGLDKARGAMVSKVMEDSPASAGGVSVGDVILSFGGQEVDSPRTLTRVVANTPTDKIVTMEVWRDGGKKTLKITTGLLDEDVIASADDGTTPSPTRESSSRSVDIDTIGLTVSGINDELRAQYNLSETSKGVLIVAVTNNSSAHQKGLLPGYLILKTGGIPVSTPEEVQTAVQSALDKGRKSVLLLIEADERTRFVALGIEK